MQKPEDRLDASETIFFKRELEAIDARMYDVKFPLLKGRQLLPKVAGIGQYDQSYTYRQFETFGEAEIIADGVKVMPKATVTGQEFTSQIKEIALGYDYGLFAVRAAAAAGRSLPDLKARGSRRGIEEKIDNLLALGDSANGLVGFVNHASVTDIAATTKAAGGTTWLTGAGLPNATAKEMVADINLLVNTIWSALKEAQGLPDRVTVVLPANEYAFLASEPMGDNADKTALAYVLANNAFLAEIIPWHKLAGQADGGGNRAIGYVKDPMVVGSIIPMEWSPQPVQQSGLLFEVPCVARCGGAVIRYPAAVRYLDDL